MSKLQRIAHITGFDTPFQAQLGGPGSFFAPKGINPAPGYLAGVQAGFTIAFGIYVPQAIGTTPFYNFDQFPAAPPPGGAAPPGQEIIAGSVPDDGAAGLGWFAACAAGIPSVSFGFTPGTPVVTLPLVQADLRPDLIVMASFVEDAEVYGFAAGDNIAVLGANGNMTPSVASVANITAPGGRFGLCGTDATPFATQVASGVAGGMSRTQLNSFWLTPGVPTAAQAREFFEVSMQAGRVVPMPWAPAKTAANLNPATPSSPTGHHWDALDVDLSQGLGTVWTDRINNVELELVGTLRGTERELARQGDHYFASV